MNTKEFISTVRETFKKLDTMLESMKNTTKIIEAYGEGKAEIDMERLEELMCGVYTGSKLFTDNWNKLDSAVAMMVFMGELSESEFNEFVDKLQVQKTAYMCFKETVYEPLRKILA